jgi:glycine/D-amino acid oxidase-like deaminating enzyme
MFINNSPWLKQLKRTRPLDRVTQDLTAGVGIIGGGIAGIVTAYYILKYTDKSVILLESNKIAHGATGHNAGQITSYFEKTFEAMIDEFGAERAAHAQGAIEKDARLLLEEIFIDTNLKTPMSQFLGYEGFTDVEQINISLTENMLREQYGLSTRELILAEGLVATDDLVPNAEKHYTFVPQENILSALETNDTQYVGALPFLSGCMNSALFTEELAGYLIAKYHDRFSLFEESHVEVLILGISNCSIKTRGGQTITLERSILCTNGFEHITIINQSGSDINTSFHHHIMGKVGFMAGYLEEAKFPPTALIYNSSHKSEEEPYLYVTRRPYEKDETGDHAIVCVGGPEYFLEKTKEYDPLMRYPSAIGERLNTFIHATYKVPKRVPYAFHWHGLMGYTTSGVRLIGAEPCNPVLMYNLGCNGVGILPSVYGAERIAKLVRGDKLEPSVFDPQDQRCPI